MFDGAAASDPMPLGAALAMGLVLLAGGGLLFVVALRSASGTLPRNWLVGIRTTVTLESDEAWDRAHRAAATYLLAGSIGTALSGVVLLLRPSNIFGLAIIVAGIGWLLGWVIRGAVVGQRAARSAD